MNPVDISEYLYNNCLSYALKRTGIDKLEDCIEISWNDNLLPKDILMWKCDDAGYFTQPMKITEDGKIIFISISENKHYAVYEGDGFVSDLSYLDSKPILRMRELNKLTAPDCIYRYKENS